MVRVDQEFSSFHYRHTRMAENPSAACSPTDPRQWLLANG